MYLRNNRTGKSLFLSGGCCSLFLLSIAGQDFFFLLGQSVFAPLPGLITLLRLASAWSVNCLVLAFSAFFLWMNSIKTRLFLNTLPLAFKYNLVKMNRSFWPHGIV